MGWLNIMYMFKVNVFEGDIDFEECFTAYEFIELRDFLKVHKFPSVPSLFAALFECKDLSSDFYFSITHNEITYTILGGVCND